MISAKEQMIHIIHNQPEDSSYDEIIKEFAFFRQKDFKIHTKL